MKQVQAVLFDISGTVLDYGSRGPVAAFVDLFANNGLVISEAEARKPMGKHKKDHIWAILSEPSIARRWAESHGGAPPNVEDLESLYVEFTPILIEAIERHCDLIPGVLEVTHELRRRGIRFANTTGFDSFMIDRLKRIAEQHGYKPDLWITPDLVGGAGRPAPWMAFHAARQFNLYPMSTFVKIGDTLADIEEAHSAGMWAVAVLRHGNEVGLAREAIEALPYPEWQRIADAARARLATAKPHYVIDSTAGLIVVIDQINARLARGEKP